MALKKGINKMTREYAVAKCLDIILSNELIDNRHFDMLEIGRYRYEIKKAIQQVWDTATALKKKTK